MRWFVAIGTALGTVLCYLSLLTLNKLGVDVDLNGVVGSIGTILGTLGLVFGAYFAFLAVNAYGQLKHLEDNNKKAEAARLDAEKLVVEATQIVDSIRKKSDEILKSESEVDAVHKKIFLVVDGLYASLHSVLTSMATGNANAKAAHIAKVDQIYAQRARTMLYLPNLPEDVLDTQLKYLAQYGEERDLALLERFESDPNISAEIRRTAKTIKDIVRQRMKS